MAESQRPYEQRVFQRETGCGKEKVFRVMFLNSEMMAEAGRLPLEKTISTSSTFLNKDCKKMLNQVLF